MKNNLHKFLFISNRYFIYGITIAILIIVIDQWSKISVVEYFKLKPIYSQIKINDYFNIVMVWNRGISFGLFHNLEASTYIFMITSIIITIILLAMLAKSNNLLTSISLSMIIGGAIGNIIDRFIYGAVADFLEFHLYDYYWPAFNIADASISIGVGLYLVDNFIEWKDQSKCKN